MDQVIPTLVPGVTDRVSQRMNAFGRIYIQLDTHRPLAGIFEEMRLSAMTRLPGERAECLMVKEPSGSAKSTVAKRFCRRIEHLVGAEYEKGPVRHITIGEKGTARDFWSSILKGLGDPKYTVGKEENLKDRVQKALRREGVVLLIVDELNHAVDKNYAGEILNAIKIMIIEGWVSIVAMGSSDELDRLPKNDGLEGRILDSPGLPRLVWAQHAATWLELCRRLDEKLVEDDILVALSDLGEPGRAQALCNVTGGLIGRLIWLISTALRNTLRRGDPCITLADLVSAGDALLLKYPRDGAVNPLGALL